MSLAELTLDRWRSLDPATAARIAHEAASQVGGRVVLLDAVEHLGGPLHRVRIEREGQEFALVPGGTVRLGFDPDAFVPTPAQSADYAESAEEGYGYGCPDLTSYLADVLSPPRTATLATVLMAVEDEALTACPDDMPAALAARGLRMPGADEWEHACGAGAGTLFRWGNECPLDQPSYGGGDGPRHEPNAFGLHIAYDSYGTELSGDPTAVHGGDGGEAVCGGYGDLLGWLPLATANRNPYAAEFTYGPDGVGMYEEFSTRPVLSLR
ncbi:hypothetical protein B6R96_02645 [Streptomyces sp. Sge12]|uniref:hypothetical protein n=1 Tax=Streptomyces sp. Sge12 TaxID=1972846 RepID=UPI0009C1CBA0|nr:hypothetical protein [Streptomyces sp. Sge12]ARE72971.1 hypothetical protein B6R96_02645 [Streptomyces sp. Sge12]